LKRAEVVVFTLALDKLNAYVTRENHYLPPLVYQQTNKDISLVFPITVNWENILSTLDGAEPLVRSIAFVDLYTGKGIPDGHRSITLRLTLGAEDRTLDGAEIESTTMRIAKRLETELAGSLRA
jgi:phenylalanyl-tRNA synthetase beta chain